MTRILDSAPFQLTLAALAAVLLVTGFVRVSRKRRPVPALPEDGAPLECWEWDEMDRIQAFYADTATEPGRKQ